MLAELPDFIGVKELNFVPFSDGIETGWRTYTHYGRDYLVVEQPQDPQFPFKLVMWVGSAVEYIVRTSSYIEATERAQKDFRKHIQSALIKI